MVEFGTQLTKLGTDPARSEKFKELWSLVAPEGKKQVPVFLTALSRQNFNIYKHEPSQLLLI